MSVSVSVVVAINERHDAIVVEDAAHKFEPMINHVKKWPHEVLMNECTAVRRVLMIVVAACEIDYVIRDFCPTKRARKNRCIASKCYTKAH